MDIRIGIKHAARELSFESKANASEIEKLVSSSLEAGGVIKFEDAKGNHYLVPSESLAYVEVGAEETRRVGFIA